MAERRPIQVDSTPRQDVRPARYPIAGPAAGKNAGMRISVLGMGRMGAAIAARLAGTGHDVTVWNRSPGKAGPAVDAGAREVRSVEEAATSGEVVITMLAADGAVREVALGDDGLVRHLPTGAVYVDASTISPTTSAELAGRFERFVAMPVLGSPEAVRSGSAVYLAGGPSWAVDAIEPVTSSLTEKLTRLDTAPLALAAKVASNFLLLGGLSVLAEAFEIGRAGGLGDDQLGAVFRDSPLVAPGLRNRFDGVLGRSTEGWFSMALGAKDVRLGVEMASRAEQDLPVARAVQARFDEAAGGDLADADVAAVGRLYLE